MEEELFMYLEKLNDIHTAGCMLKVSSLSKYRFTVWNIVEMSRIAAGDDIEQLIKDIQLYLKHKED